MIMAAPFPSGCPQLEHSFFPLTDLQETGGDTEDQVMDSVLISCRCI